MARLKIVRPERSWSVLEMKIMRYLREVACIALFVVGGLATGCATVRGLGEAKRETHRLTTDYKGEMVLEEVGPPK